MNEQDIKKILPEWSLSYTLSEKKGEKLYQAERAIGDATKYSVIRTISIPADKEEEERLSERLANVDEYKKYVSECVKRKKEELRLLRKLCEKPGIVCMRESYDVSNNDETGYILIARYDYIEPLNRYISSNGLTVGNAIRMGVDICHGLESLHKENIIHGNVRPDNIYINSAGRFRLGGFDIDLIKGRKQLPEKTISALRFISPEMCMGEGKDVTSDVYALGMVLYSLLNGGKLPFENEFGQDKALKMRLLGEPIPRPAYDAGKLTDIVMKACSFDPKNRYASPLLMRHDLEAAFAEFREAFLEKRAADRDEQSGRSMTFSDNRKPYEDSEKFDEKAFDKMAEKKRREQKNGAKMTAAALGIMTAILLLCVAVYFGIGRDIESYGVHLDSGYNYTYDGELKQPTVTLNTLTEGKQFIVSYSNNKKIGEATVTVKGIGRFRGEKTETFKILPPSCTDFKSAEATESSVKLTWKKASAATEYRIYLYNSETNSWKKLKTVPSSDNSCVIEGLEPETSYKFRIKTGYKTGGSVYLSKSVATTAETLKHEGW